MRAILIGATLAWGLIGCGGAADSAPQGGASQHVGGGGGATPLDPGTGGVEPGTGGGNGSSGSTGSSGSSGSSGSTGVPTRPHVIALHGSGGATSDGVGGTQDGVGGSGGGTGDGVGGSGGSTGDGVGGSGGNTGDGVGGSGGNTGDNVGGTGNTGDNVGGTGNTGDNVGGTGNTGDGTGGSPPTQDGPGCLPSYMDSINVLTFGDANPTGADTEGRMFVGGNANLPAGYAVGAGLTSDCTRRDLVVRGNLTFPGGRVPNGKVSVGGTPTVGATLSCGLERNASAFDFVTAETQLTRYSQSLAGITANGTTTESYGSLILTGTDATLNVFNVTAAQIGAVHQITYAVPATSTVVINVSGTSVSMAGVGYPGGLCKAETSTECQAVIYNFYQATSLTITGTGLQGALLAPAAALNLENGDIDGQVIVHSLTGGGEYHPFMFLHCTGLTW